MRRMMTVAALLLLVFGSFIVMNDNVSAGDSVPTIYIPATTPHTWKQFSRISMRPIFDDADAGDTLTLSVNMDHSILLEDPIVEQLPYADLTKGTVWDFDNSTGDFRMELDDQNIWWNGTDMVDSLYLYIAFEVKDQDGNSDSTSYELVLKDENQEPEKPDKIFFSPSKPKAKEPVNFWVDEVSDPEHDELSYKWDFGDGSTGEGINVNHTYATKGYKTVQMWVEDQQFGTEKTSIRIEIQEEWDPNDDEDEDGIKNSEDAFPEDPAASVDTDEDGYPDEWNEGYASDDSTTGLKIDEFPNDHYEWADSDKDGVGDRSDKFPNDPSASIDSDMDGSPDSWNLYMNATNSTTGLYIDAFPYDHCSSVDTDGDGYPDRWHSNLTIEDIVTNLTLDAFPTDPNEWNDTDGDGIGDNSDVFPNDPSEWYDTDLDSIGDNTDAFPYDASEWNDTDGDGVGDNSDAFPNDPTEQNDTDGDNVGNNADAFPNDPAASIDTDYDGFPDKWNEGMSEEDSTTGLQLDRYPNDIGKALPSEEEFPYNILILVSIGIIVLLLGVLGVLFVIKKKRGELSDEERELQRYLKDSEGDETDIHRIKSELRSLKRAGKISDVTYSRAVDLVGEDDKDIEISKGKI